MIARNLAGSLVSFGRHQQGFSGFGLEGCSRVAMPALHHSGMDCGMFVHVQSPDFPAASSSSAPYIARCSSETSQDLDESASCCLRLDLCNRNIGMLSVKEQMPLLEPLGPPRLLSTSDDQDQSALLLLDILAGAHQMQNKLSVSADGPCSFGPTIDFERRSENPCTVATSNCGRGAALKGSAHSPICDIPSLPISFFSEQKTGMLGGSPCSDMSVRSPYASPGCHDVMMCSGDKALLSSAVLEQGVHQSVQRTASWLAYSSQDAA
jgi:hypothetical protein